MKMLFTMLQHLNPKNLWDIKRRNTPQYRNKQRIVKKVWFASSIFIVVGLIVFPPIGVVMLLQTTFISFCILDETPEVDPKSSHLFLA